jgi:hypothetical protein
VGAPGVIHRLGGGGEGLAQDLAAEHIAKPQILGISPVNVFLDFFEFQQCQKFIQYIVNGCAGIHRRSFSGVSVLANSDFFPPVFHQAIIISFLSLIFVFFWQTLLKIQNLWIN